MGFFSIDTAEQLKKQKLIQECQKRKNATLYALDCFCEAHQDLPDLIRETGAVKRTYAAVYHADESHCDKWGVTHIYYNFYFRVDGQILKSMSYDHRPEGADDPKVKKKKSSVKEFKDFVLKELSGLGQSYWLNSELHSSEECYNINNVRFLELACKGNKTTVHSGAGRFTHFHITGVGEKEDIMENVKQFFLNSIVGK